MMNRLNLPQASDGRLFAANHHESHTHLWHAFYSGQNPASLYERILEAEILNIQFFGDYNGLDRLAHVTGLSPLSATRDPAALLFAARFYTLSHRFYDADAALERARHFGADEALVQSLQCTLDQARGDNLDHVLAYRQNLCHQTPRISHFVSLGALLADLGEHEKAKQAYLRSFELSANLSPIGYAWASFQLGVLWGETMTEPDPEQASFWYRTALNYMPHYTHAAIHLAECKIMEGAYEEASQLLDSVATTDEPEIRWRKAELLAQSGDQAAADIELYATRHAYERLLARHELAFADHAAEFYVETGLDPARAMALAFTNLSNRPTPRAYDLVYRATTASAAAELMKPA
jgi:tetratricopeptide (TPR) repeat protein